MKVDLKMGLLDKTEMRLNFRGMIQHRRTVA